MKFKHVVIDNIDEKQITIIYLESTIESSIESEFFPYYFEFWLVFYLTIYIYKTQN